MNIARHHYGLVIVAVLLIVASGREAAGQESSAAKPVYDDQVAPIYFQPSEVGPIPGPTFEPSDIPGTNPDLPDVLDSVPPITWKRTQATVTVLPGSGNNFGVTDFDVQGTIGFGALPQFTITPGFQMAFLNGPRRTDLPGRVFNARAEFRWFQPPGTVSQWGYELAVAPGIYSDFERENSDAIRILGRAIGFYAHSPQTQYVFGIAYLDRENLAVLPVFGVILLPRDDVRLELIFPQPRVAYRLMRDESGSRWIYLPGEFGGGSWAIQRTTGRKDIATYSDWRLILGLETKFITGRRWLLEAGYVFNRQLEYDSGPGDFDPGDTAMIRAGFTF